MNDNNIHPTNNKRDTLKGISLRPHGDAEDTGYVRIIELPAHWQEDVIHLMASHSRAFKNQESYFRNIINQPGKKLYSAYLHQKGKARCVGALILSSLHNLPISDGIAEISEMVVDRNFRKIGIGSKLLSFSVAEAQNMGFKSVYLKTSPKMVVIKHLLERQGFSPITGLHERLKESEFTNETTKQIPCYYILRFVPDVFQASC